MGIGLRVACQSISTQHPEARGAQLCCCITNSDDLDDLTISLD